MIHQAWTIAMGNADDLRATAGLLDKVDGTMIDGYVRRAPGKDPNEVKAWMSAETWFDAEEAIDAGFCNMPSTAASGAAKAQRLQPRGLRERAPRRSPNRSRTTACASACSRASASTSERPPSRPLTRRRSPGRPS
jgi:hypothetical protein